MNRYRYLIPRVKQELLTTDAEFICIAIARVAYQHPLLAKTADTLKARIEAGLDGEHTFDFWCFRQGLDLTQNQLQLARLAWLDKLLSENCP